MILDIYDYIKYDNDKEAKELKESIYPVVDDLNGYWVYDEPEFATKYNMKATFTLFSNKFGVVFIKAFPEYNGGNKINEKFWEIDGREVISPIMQFRDFVHTVESKITEPSNEIESETKITTIYYIPGIKECEAIKLGLKSKEYLINKADNISTIFDDLLSSSSKINEGDYKKILRILQKADIVQKISTSYIVEPAKNISEAIELNNKQIANFDNMQMKASLTITDESERIRGLAGTGKTVVLAIKAAKLHKLYPDKKIAFVFYTKSLYSQTISYIRKYYLSIADAEPNWDNLKVLHSWGGKTTGEGFYTYICRENSIQPKTYNDLTFSAACEELNNVEGELVRSFDYILVDEAQDFPLSFFKLIEKVCKLPRKVVIAYDELQTTNDNRIPEFEELFGKDENGNAIISLNSRFDYVLKKTYRNDPKVLFTAVALGFGFYADLVQIIKSEETWNALGFDCETVLENGKNVVISRDPQNSPNSISKFLNNETVDYENFDTPEHESNKVVEIITNLINEEHVQPQDILVIDVNNNKNDFLKNIQAKLSLNSIESHIPGIITDSREFIKQDKVTLSTPRNSKGNEVPVVIVVNAEIIYKARNKERGRISRNFLFISITRAKAMVRIFACDKTQQFVNEMKKIIDNYPKYKFKFPTLEEEKELQTIDLIMKNPSARKLNNTLESLNKLLNNPTELELAAKLIQGNPELVEKLKELMNNDDDTKN